MNNPEEHPSHMSEEEKKAIQDKAASEIQDEEIFNASDSFITRLRNKQNRTSVVMAFGNCYLDFLGDGVKEVGTEFIYAANVVDLWKYLRNKIGGP